MKVLENMQVDRNKMVMAWDVQWDRPTPGICMGTCVYPYIRYSQKRKFLSWGPPSETEPAVTEMKSIGGRTNRKCQVPEAAVASADCKKEEIFEHLFLFPLWRWIIGSVFILKVGFLFFHVLQGNFRGDIWHSRCRFFHIRNTSSTQVMKSVNC